MSKYSSDSDSVDSFKRKNKKGHRRSSSSSSSSGRYSRQKKSKRHRKSRRSRSRERRGKHSRKYSKDRDRRSSRRSRSRSNSTTVSRSSRGGGGRKSRSWSRERRRRSSRSESRPRRSRSRDVAGQSSSTRRPPSNSSSKDDGSELLERLNKAAVQAMADNARLREATLDLVNQQTNRESVLDDINSPNFAPKTFSSTAASNDATRCVDTPPSRPSSKLEALVQEVHGSLLHPNLLLDDPEDKLNRWVKKIYQIRQRAIIGEPLNFV